MEQIKTYGKMRNIPSNVEETRTITFLASDSTTDRHDTVINMDNWEVNAFRANPIIGWQHNVYGANICGEADPDQIIGKGDVRIEDQEMLVDITFESAENNPLAEKIFRKVLAGILNAVSVGFIELGEGAQGDTERGQDPSVYYFGGQELLEVSVVSIPSNKNALVKSLRSQSYDALKFVYQELGGKKRMSEIEEMTVREILDLMEGTKPEEKTVPVSEFKQRLLKSKHSALTLGNK
jgi:HK97 family phage prohead protease